MLARLAAAVDRVCIDGLVDGAARVTRWVAHWWLIVDGSVNLLAYCTHAVGLWLRVFQTGRLRQYVMFIMVGAIAIFLLISFFLHLIILGSRGSYLVFAVLSPLVAHNLLHGKSIFLILKNTYTFSYYMS